jgi:hypothetical protein
MGPFSPTLLQPFWFDYQQLLPDFELGPEEEVKFEIDELFNYEDEVEPPRTPPFKEAWDVYRRKKGKEIIDPNTKKGLKLGFIDSKKIDFSKNTAGWLSE